MFYNENFTANAACPQRPSWNISEVGYAWAQEVVNFHRKRKKLFGNRKKAETMSAQQEAFRFELQKPYKKNNPIIFGTCKKKAVALCRSGNRQDSGELTA